MIGDERWSDEPGFDAAAVTGVCGSAASSRSIAELFLAGVITTDGVIDGSLADRTRSRRRRRPDVLVRAARRPGAPRLVITQNDVRQIQLAKGALYAGCRLLMDALGIETVDRIRLAGAFGAHIDPVHAMVLGLVPDCDPAQRHERRERRRHRRPHRAAEPGRARRDRGRRPPRGEARDRGGAAVPGALRRRDGHPARHRSVPAARRRSSTCPSAHAAAAGDRPRRRRRSHRTERSTHMSDEPSQPRAPAASTGGRAGRAAARLAARRREGARSSRATLTPVEVLERGGPRDDRAQRRHDPRDRSASTSARRPTRSSC